MSSSHRVCGRACGLCACRCMSSCGSHSAAKREHLSLLCLAMRAAHRHLRCKYVFVHSWMFSLTACSSTTSVACLIKSGQGSSSSSCGLVIKCCRSSVGGLLETSFAEFSLALWSLPSWSIGCVFRLGVPIMRRSIRRCVR